MKKTKLSIIGLVAATCSITAGVLSSCGGTPDEGLVIDVWNTFNHQQVPIFDSIMKSFEDYILDTEGVELKVKSTVVGGYDEMESQIVSGFNIGRTPTIAVAYPDNVANYISNEKYPGQYIVDLTEKAVDPEIGFDAEPDLCNQGITDFVPSYLEEGTKYAREGSLLSLPFEKSTELLLYNKNVVQKALTDMKIRIPAEHYMDTITWEKLFELMEYINNNRSKYGMEDKETEKKYMLFYDSDANLFITQAFQRNIDYISLNNGKGSIDFNNDKVEVMLNEFKDLYDKKILCTGDTENRYGSDYFKLKRCVFTVGSSGGSGYSGTGDFDVGVAKFPFYQEKQDDGTYKDIPVERQKFVSQGVTLALFNNPSIKDKEINDQKILYGWKFLKYLTNPLNSMQMCAQSNGYVPPRKSSYEIPVYKQFLARKGYMSKCANTVINDINGRYYNYPVFPGSATARDEVGSLVSKTLKLKPGSSTTVKSLMDDAYNKTILAMERH